MAFFVERNFGKSISNIIEFIEIFINNYLKIAMNLMFSPKKAYSTITDATSKKVPPFLFFVLNIFLVVLLKGSKNTKEILDSLLKNLFFLNKISFDNLFEGFIGFILGLIIFILILRFFERKLNKQNSSLEVVLDSVLFASFIFVPMIIIERIILIIYGDFFGVFSDIVASNNERIMYGYFTLLLLKSLLFMFYWLYLVYRGIRAKSDSNKKNIIKALLLTSSSFVIIQITIISTPSIIKLGSFIVGYRYYNETETIIQNQQPDYLKAGLLSYYNSNNEAFTPYGRYVASLKTVVFLTRAIEKTQTPLFSQALNKLKNEDYEWIEEIYSTAIKNTLSKKLDNYNYGIINIMKLSLENAKKMKSLPDFRIGDLNANLSVFISDLNVEYLKLLP